MIEINSLPSQAFQGQFYKINYERLGFLLFPSPDLSPLQHFSSTRQKDLGKMFLKFDLTWLLKYHPFFKETNYVLLTDYKQILFLPYLLRMVPNAHIIATNLTYQLARIALESFQETLAEYDSTSSTLDFQKESEVVGLYEQKFEANFEDWRRLYSKQQVQNTLKRVIKVNYHQNYNTERGVQLRAFPSGKNNGSCCWELFGMLAGQKILLVNQISHYNWRTCRSLDLSRIKESHELSAYSLVIFTKKALETKEGQEAKLAQAVKKINSNAQNSISTTIVLEDDTLCVDLIPRLSTYPEGKLRGILLKQRSYHFFHNVINSYVDYLSDHYRNQIFCQSPDYPLAHYSKLKEKGLLVIGSLEEAAVKSKLPLREIVSQCHPFVQFISSYQYYLQSEQVAAYFSNVKHVYEQVKLGSNFTSIMLSNFLAAVPKARILGFSQGHANVQILQFDKKYSLGPQKRLSYHIAVTNCSKNQYQKFTLANNQLKFSEATMQLCKLSKNWPELMHKDLKARGVPVLQMFRNSIKLKNSLVAVTPEYTVQIVSSDAEELMIIEKWFRENGTRYLLP